MKGKEEYIRAMQAKLEEWIADIDALTNKASDGSAKLRIRPNLVSSKQL
jgi:hypothetical protein